MRVLFILLAIIGALAVSAQNRGTTVILLRHAEKVTDGTKDPDLSDEGKKRAELLINIFSKTKIVAIYSTHFKRTESTVAPLALAHQLSVQNYDGGKPTEIDDIITKYQGGTVIICGHSNTTPALINYLTGHVDEFKTFNDTDYGNLVIVTVLQKGKESSVTWLRY